MTDGDTNDVASDNINDNDDDKDNECNIKIEKRCKSTSSVMKMKAKLLFSVHSNQRRLVSLVGCCAMFSKLRRRCSTQN